MNPLSKLYIELYGKNYQADTDALNKNVVQYSGECEWNISQNTNRSFLSVMLVVLIRGVLALCFKKEVIFQQYTLYKIKFCYIVQKHM